MLLTGFQFVERGCRNQDANTNVYVVTRSKSHRNQENTEKKPVRALVESLLSLAADMNLDVVAEGVETRAQSHYLFTAGCPSAQGYGYARPMPINALRELIAKEIVSIERARMQRPAPASK